MSDEVTFKRSTIDEVLWLCPGKENYQSNKYKSWREAWLVAMFCNDLGYEGLITAPHEEPADVLLEVDGSQYLIQCAECKNEGPRGSPTDHPIKTLESGMLEFPLAGEYNPYIDVHNRIFEVIKGKYEKYIGKYGDRVCGRLILLVYENIYFTTEMDLDLTKMRNRCSSLNFRSIYIRSDGRNFHIAGEVL